MPILKQNLWNFVQIWPKKKSFVFNLQELKVFNDTVCVVRLSLLYQGKICWTIVNVFICVRWVEQKLS